SDMLPPHKRFGMTSPHPDTTDEVTAEAILARLRKRIEAHRWTFVLDSIRTLRYQEGLPSTFELGKSSLASHVPLVTSELVYHTIPLLVYLKVTHDSLRIAGDRIIES
nr:hypothetical protein [Tanacetum cinerariifolium]